MNKKLQSFLLCTLIFPSLSSCGGAFQSEPVISQQQQPPFTEFVKTKPVLKGPEFKVDEVVSGNEFYPVVAMDKKGNYIVAWKSSNGIYARRFNKKNERQDKEFKVSGETIVNDGSQPSIAINNETGDFIICWNAYNSEKANYQVYVQRYNSKGETQDAPVKVNNEIIDLSRTRTSLVYADPINPVDQHLYFHTVTDLAMNTKGEFAVTWSSYSQDGSSNNIYAQAYDNKGIAKGAKIKINNQLKGNLHDPKIVIDNDSNFVITWGLYKKSVEDANKYGFASGIYAQRYNSKGEAQGDELKVNSINEGVMEEPSLATDESGNLTIAWSVYKVSKQTNYLNEAFSGGIYFQKFKTDGSPDGKQVRVAGPQEFIQSYPKVAGDENGNFIISWLKDDFIKGDDRSIHCLRFNKSSNQIGREFTVSNLEFKYSHNLAASTKGSFIEVWDGYEDLDDSTDIYARKYDK